MSKRKHPLVAGTRVMYKVAFLRSIHNYSAALANLRGTVLSAEDFGNGQLCVVKWDNTLIKSDYYDDGCARIIDANLTTIQG